jgi:hypothetical protein
MVVKPFQTAFILSGGGTRLMIYLGMLAALEELNKKPDVLIATCGGAFAATVFNTFPNHLQRKEFLKSKEYFNFISNVKLSKERKLSKIGFFTLKKIFENRNAPFLENIFDDYLVEITQNLEELFPDLQNTLFSQEIPTIIIGSKVLYEPKNCGKNRNNQKLYQKTIFTDIETAGKIDLEKIKNPEEIINNTAVSENIKLNTSFSLLQSARISMSDMFYIAPYFSQGKYFAGGAIDLVPIEFAKAIAKKVIIEKKQSYSLVEEAMVRSVFGYSGNKRLIEISNQIIDYQIDTTCIKKNLKGHYLKKSINWKKFEIAFSQSKSYQAFRTDMDFQWEYGFQQVIKSFSKKN